MAPSLDVVIVAYGSPELLRACLRSVEAHPLSDGETSVHVADNDGSAEAVVREFPRVRLHPMGRNAGFSTANNAVLRATGAPLALLLNPDTELRPGVLDQMAGLMREHPDVGMAGCRLVRPDGSFDHAAKRSFPTPLSALAHFSGVGRRAQGGRLAQYRATTVDEHGAGEVDAVNGAFMLVRRAALAEVGLLDEGYWLYMEDLDWCARFWQHGWKVRYDGTVTAIHVKGGTAGARRRLKANVHFHRGMGRFYRRHQGGRNPWLDLAVYLGIGAKLALSVASNAGARRLAGRSR